MAQDDDFLQAAEALYALPAAEFVAGRSARAKQARADGDRDLAARISALQKPSAAAALVNRLVHEGGDLLDRVEDLGAALRQAQDEGDPKRLRELGADRRRLLTDAVDRAAELAGSRPGAAVIEDLQQTLQAALASEDTAAAVATGRLVTALSADGLDPVDLTNAVGGPGRVAPRHRRPAPSRSAGASGDAAADREAAEQRAAARREAEQRADAAEARAAEAEQAATSAGTEADAAEERRAEQERAVARLRDRIARLQEELEGAETDLQGAEDAAASARSSADDAARDAEDARTEADEARAAVPED
ncbi:transposase [Amnibacterium setariae]|uniref:Transposase n=1 Tax=Amnibacterium setariae TaxID=2306585 RepID=A0A3A1UAU7_9MICO|nr:transposase [Amnibacterium setariae]RIX30456.1 transposase [Amnibacterium setariae]